MAVLNDVQKPGPPECAQGTWTFICKYEAKGSIEITKAMQISDKGCMVQVTSLRRNEDGSYDTAHALAFAPGVELVKVFGGDYTLA